MDTFNGLFSSLASGLMQVLPLSPFADFFSQWAGGAYPTIQTGMGWLNWFFPVGAALRLVAAWLVVVASYYIYSIVMRWVKVIG